MEPSYSLAYYERIFGGVRGPTYRELVDALADELDDYASAVEAWARTGAPAEALASLRHAHRPLVLNLALNDVRTLEDQLRLAAEAQDPALEVLGGELAALTRATAQALRGKAPSAT